MVSVLSAARAVYCGLSAAACSNPILYPIARCKITRYTIIGSGAAGIAAVESIRSIDAGAEIDLLGAERSGYYSRPGLAYYLTGELNEKQLFPFREQDFNKLGVRPKTAPVDKILPEQHLVELRDGSYLGYDRLLIATGASAASINIPGINLKGVVKLDNLADAQRILGQARRRRKAVVVGGGITALEIVEGLVARGVKTHYFLRGDRYWHNVLDETESRIIEGRLKEHGTGRQVVKTTWVAMVVDLQLNPRTRAYRGWQGGPTGGERCAVDVKHSAIMQHAAGRVANGG